ncbi:cytochrome P450 315a1, mitochondrial-like [Daphnia pulex]|uniref:cytochrome P450 315a1, mitochondrial-like n=1 Tax=Daphnia pulex TaxID=6669 RepID=UPI001EDF478A|nr:cytochrome P450 315a1, mitochondrial-like [Daphnia pulex]
MASYLRHPIRRISLLERRCYTAKSQPFDSIPAPKGLPLIGTLWDVIRAGGVSQIHRYIDDRHRQLGPIFREKLGHVEAVWLADPALYQQVFQKEGTCPRPMLPEPWLILNKKHAYKRGLFFMQGEEWLRYRKILSPLLLKTATLHRHIESFYDVADRLLDKWEHTENGLITHLEGDLYRYFVQGLMCVAFGRVIGLDQEIVDTYVPGMVQHLQTLFESSARLTLLPPALAAKLNLDAWRCFEQSALSALQLANQLTQTCLEKLPPQDDSNEDDCIVSSLRQQKMVKSDIQRIVADLFLAAADTTSHTTQWVLYLLARHPEVQNKIFNEIELVQSSKQRIGDEWQHIPTIKGSVKEALRLYPVATFLTRIMQEQCTIGGYSIPPDTIMLMSAYTSGRDERYFRNAQDFIPERWNRHGPSNGMVMDPFASLPFGHGRRGCIGRRLAESQMYILLYKAIPRFTFQAENHVKMIMRLLGTVDQPVQLRLQPRS